ncbi:hypothetical protein [Streptomyces sp. NPDC005799]|uniref:hypothetical protein n=1 Tax=Streptomyces sp. NPDC005799 TaxID=3154678 RepID=UPI0033C7F9CA
MPNRTDHRTTEHPPGLPEPSYASPWPEDCIARYLTPAGEHVDITYVSRAGYLLSTCTGCGNVDDTDTYGLLSDPPEKEDARIEKALPEAREQAQAHAERCRALPRPTVTS